MSLGAASRHVSQSGVRVACSGSPAEKPRQPPPPFSFGKPARHHKTVIGDSTGRREPAVRGWLRSAAWPEDRSCRPPALVVAGTIGERQGEQTDGLAWPWLDALPKI